MLDDLDLVGKFVLLGGLGAQQGFLAGGLEFFIEGLEDAVKILNAQIPEIFGADPALEGKTVLIAACDFKQFHSGYLISVFKLRP